MLSSAIKYWRTKSKAEVDFIIEEGSVPYPFEVKYTSKKVIGKSLYSFIEKFHPHVAVVFTKDFTGEAHVSDTHLKFVPLPYY